MRNITLEASGLVIKGAGFLTDVFLTSTGKDGRAILHDGRNTDGEKIVTVRNSDGCDGNFKPTTWPRFTSGLYLELTGTDATVNIGWRDSP